MLKQHLDMIGRNEPIQRKAKFWQSYVRALKGIRFFFFTLGFHCNYYRYGLSRAYVKITTNRHRFKIEKNRLYFWSRAAHVYNM